MRNLLIETNRFLVHGYTSNSSKGSLSERIAFTFENANSHELCVCTVALGDHTRINCFQPVGLIVGNSNKITYCRNRDGGTMRLDNGDLNGITEGGFFDPTQSQVKDTILNRPQGTYNEFRIKNYEILGFYISKDEGELGAVELIITNEGLFYEQTCGYKLPYYFVTNGLLNEVTFNKEYNQFSFVKQVSNKDLYGN